MAVTDDRVNGDFVAHTNDNGSWKNGRQLLRQYVYVCLLFEFTVLIVI